MNATSRINHVPPSGKNYTTNVQNLQRMNSASRIPIDNNRNDNRWKLKYEETDQKRKILLTENVKLMKEKDDVEKKYLDLQEKHEFLETELFEKNEEFMQLTTASKNLYKEYETLRNKYDVEVSAMSSALKDASQWYKQNKELKRQTLICLDKDIVDEGVDTGEGTPDADIENLNKTIKDLSSEVAKLQTEVECLKQTEFFTTEENIRLTEELDQEKEKSRKIIQELASIQNENSQLKRITQMMSSEIEDMKRLEDTKKNEMDILRKEATDYKKERNVLAHQSTLLLKGVSADNVENCLALLKEVEELKGQQEELRNKYEDEIASLQEKLEIQVDNSQTEILEEKLKLLESDLKQYKERTELAEKELEEVKKFQLPPPPPPPPPLPLTSTEPPVVPLRTKRRSRINIMEPTETKEIETEESSSNKSATPGVNEDIINAIKEGKFTLRKTKSQAKKEKESSKTVSELLNILGSLRRARGNRKSFLASDPK